MMEGKTASFGSSTQRFGVERTLQITDNACTEERLKHGFDLIECRLPFEPLSLRNFLLNLRATRVVGKQGQPVAKPLF